MDYIQFHCPSCNHLLVVPPEAAGLSGPCPNCQTTIHGPQAKPALQPQPLNPPAPQPQTAPPARSQAQDFAEVPAVEQIPTQPEPTPSQPTSPYAQELPKTGSAPAPAPEPSPIPDTIEPAPVEDVSPNPRESRRTKGISFLQAFILCFLSAITFFILGFFLGKTGAVSWDEIALRMKEQQAQEETQKAADTAGELTSTTEPAATSPSVEPLSTQAEPLNEETKEIYRAKATLETFLEAETWGARNAFVLNSKEVLSHMAASAAVHGDGPIAVETIELEQAFPQTIIFQVKTPRHPEPFLVLMIQDGGWWLVDWLGFADFYHNRLDSFAKGKDGPMKGLFRVLLKPAPGETAPLSPARCLVRTTQLPDNYQVNIGTDSNARSQLASIFQNYMQVEKDEFEKAMADGGIPLIVELSRNGAENPTLQLERIVTTTWPPLPKNEIKKEPSSSFY